MQVLYLQISYNYNILFSLNKETVEKSFGLLTLFLISFFELNICYLSLIHNQDPIFLYSKLNVDKIEHSIVFKT